MEGLQLVEAYLVSCAYSILGFELFYNFRSGVSKLLKECAFTYLRTETIRSHAGKAVYEWRQLGKMQASILRAVNLMLAPIEHSSSFSGQGTNF